MLNALTFDLEEYFQVEAFKAVVGFADWDGFPSRVTPQTHRLLDLLDTRNVTGTFFVVGWVAERQSALLRHIHERGHEVACHGQAHQMISAMTPDEVRADVRRAQPAIFYIHPWEIDPDQPRLSVSGLNRFRHYVNLRHTAGKLARLLDDFSFGPVRDVLKEYDLVVVPR